MIGGRERGDPEIGEEWTPRGVLEQHVAGFDVAMDHPGSMHVIERARQHRQEAARRPRLEPPLAMQPLGERLPFHVSHDHQAKPPPLLESEHRDDVRMLEPARDARLAPEPLAVLQHPAKVRTQHLDGHVALERELPGEIDRAHPATCERTLDFVAAGRDRLECPTLFRHLCVRAVHTAPLDPCARPLNRLSVPTPAPRRPPVRRGRSRFPPASGNTPLSK